ncbi:hypothetical protein M405DRAFT_95468 [Rhizopogon salebrosus TDB-379]|nr:hypothetical protein M405DRAFT_95468 [Rhizopogon salebrosus TDB-379]
MVPVPPCFSSAPPRELIAHSLTDSQCSLGWESMSTIRTFTTSAAFGESLRAQDPNWNMDRYVDYKNINSIKGLAPLCRIPAIRCLSTRIKVPTEQLIIISCLSPLPF